MLLFEKIDCYVKLSTLEFQVAKFGKPLNILKKDQSDRIGRTYSCFKWTALEVPSGKLPLAAKYSRGKCSVEPLEFGDKVNVIKRALS